MNYLQAFFNPVHLFSLRPEAMTNRAVAVTLAIFVACLVLAGLAWFKKSKAQSGLDMKIWSKIVTFGLTVGIIGLVYTFFAWQGVALFSARFWLLILLLIALGWAGLIAKYAAIDLPKIKKTISKDKEFKKYIP